MSGDMTLPEMLTELIARAASVEREKRDLEIQIARLEGINEKLCDQIFDMEEVISKLREGKAA